MKKSLALALALAAIPAAQASLVTTALSADPANTAPYASTTGDTLIQPLHGVTIDNRNSTNEAISNLTWAVDANKPVTGYSAFTLRLRGSYYAPPSYDADGNANTVIQIGGSVKTFDNTHPLTPLAVGTIPYKEFAFANVLTPFDVTITVNNPYAVTNGHVEAELYLYAAQGTYLTFDDLTLTTQPVPEPASMAALGLGGLALLRRRRKA